MFHIRRDRELSNSLPEVSWRYVITFACIVLFVLVPLGILLGRWTQPWLLKLCTAIAQWLFD